MGDQPVAPTQGGNSGAELVWLDPSVIVWPAVRITSQYRDGEADALARSIEGIGQQQPVGVYLVDGLYVGADGMNRCMRAMERGETSILCVVRPGQSIDVLKSNIATALLRGHTNPLSVVETLDAAYQDGVDIHELAVSSGHTVDWVERMLSIAPASPAVLQALGEEMIAQGHAELLSRLEDHAAQEEALGHVLRHRLTVRELEVHLAGGDEGEEDAAPKPGRPAGQDKGPVACSMCHREHERTVVQTLQVCGECMPGLTSPQGDQPVAPTEEGERYLDVTLAEALRSAAAALREAEEVLASSPGSVHLAERLGALATLAEESEE